uniref:Uncharacterized protein n=1 Tax=Quercus lobata TaxID=97700 RepID=A0A7N2L974_QUELO
MYPEVKIKPEVKYKTANTSSEAVEREYFEHNEPKKRNKLPFLKEVSKIQQLPQEMYHVGGMQQNSS